jgi:drug/metabolite transporter (DMT)-like permease
LRKTVADRAPESADPSNRGGLSGHWHAVALLGVLIFAWGGNYTWIKLALRDVGPWTFNAARYLGASLVIGAMLASRRGLRGILPPRDERAGLAVIGVLQGAVLTGMITVSLGWIESTHTILLIYTNPVWTLLLSVFLLGERLTGTGIAGVGLGLLGVALLTNPLAMRWDAATVPGVVSALVATVAWALGSVLYRRAQLRSSFWQQVFWQLAASAIVMTLAAAILESHEVIRPTARLAAITLYNVLVPTALAYWCWAQALSRIKASTASQILLLSPVFGVAQSHLLLDEALSPAVLASAVCVVAGAGLTFWRPAN